MSSHSEIIQTWITFHLEMLCFSQKWMDSDIHSVHVPEKQVDYFQSDCKGGMKLIVRREKRNLIFPDKYVSVSCQTRYGIEPRARDQPVAIYSSKQVII